ncbi:hypothetical protein HDV06_005560 [Boothiomyces sp. JEL0866]|nr:hypothetical protein HDV06_005560 [Boothiomyces sp. JEL0866]
MLKRIKNFILMKTTALSKVLEINLDDLNNYPITEVSADDDPPKTPQRPYSQENKNIYYYPPKVPNRDLDATPKASDYNTGTSHSYSEATHPTYNPDTIHTYSQKTYPTYNPNIGKENNYPTQSSNHVYRDMNPDSTYNSEYHGVADPSHDPRYSQFYNYPEQPNYYDYSNQQRYLEADYEIQPNYSHNLDATGNQNNSQNLDFANGKLENYGTGNQYEQYYHYDPNYTALYEKIKDQEPPEDELYPSSEAFLDNFHANMVKEKNETLVSQDSVASMIVNEKEIKYMNALLNQ